ncbi:MAG: hypothetical protein HUN04_04550 [Desulfobacter sp.]|nr:MAG: hypothetical protein HUN04_04550 [Desulfobacter sp.]
MNQKKAAAVESKSTAGRSVHSQNFNGVVDMTFSEETNPPNNKGYEWDHDDERLQDLLYTLDEIESEWRNQGTITNRKNFPIKQFDPEIDGSIIAFNKDSSVCPERSTFLTTENAGFISCEGGCVLIKWVYNGMETVYEKFDNLDNFWQFKEELHFALEWARSDVEEEF